MLHETGGEGERGGVSNGEQGVGKQKGKAVTHLPEFMYGTDVEKNI